MSWEGHDIKMKSSHIESYATEIKQDRKDRKKQTWHESNARRSVHVTQQFRGLDKLCGITKT